MKHQVYITKYFKKGGWNAEPFKMTIKEIKDYIEENNKLIEPVVVSNTIVWVLTRINHPKYLTVEISVVKKSRNLDIFKLIKEG